MTLTPEPSPFAAALVRHTAVPGMGWARVSGSRNASAHGKGLAQPVPVAGDMRSPGIGSWACQPLPFSARFRHRLTTEVNGAFAVRSKASLEPFALAPACAGWTQLRR